MKKNQALNNMKTALFNVHTGANQPQLNTTKITRLAGRLLAAAVLFGFTALAPPAIAAAVCTGAATDPDTCTSRTAVNGSTSVCAGNLAGFNLNCTANDVVVAKVTNIRDGAGNLITSCTMGSQLDFTADFDVQVNGGVTRYDIGLYFSTDGDPNHDSAATGTSCSVSKLSGPIGSGNDANFKQLDAAPDSCGDVDKTPALHKAHLPLSIPCQPSPLFYNATTKSCQATAPSAGAPHCVSLPNLVSWRQTGANNTCTSPLNTFPGSPSKCKSDPSFGIPIIVEPPSLTVDKTADPATVPETGGAVTFTVKITNNASVSTLTLDSLVDEANYGTFGNLLDSTNSNVSNNTCPAMVAAANPLAGGGYVTCSFQATLSGNTGDKLTDTVTACGTTNNQQACGHHAATVTVTDVATKPSVSKTVTSHTIDVTYTVVVTNNSVVDKLTINGLTDDKFGDITSIHDASTGIEQVVSTTCVNGTVIPVASDATPPDNQYSCTFVGRLLNSSNNPHVNTVTATTTDSDGVEFKPMDNASVEVKIQ